MREARVKLQRAEGRGGPEPGPLGMAELLAQPSMKPTHPASALPKQITMALQSRPGWTWEAAVQLLGKGGWWSRGWVCRRACCAWVYMRQKEIVSTTRTDGQATEKTAPTFPAALPSVSAGLKPPPAGCREGLERSGKDSEKAPREGEASRPSSARTALSPAQPCCPLCFPSHPPAGQAASQQASSELCGPARPCAPRTAGSRLLQACSAFSLSRQQRFLKRPCQFSSSWALGTTPSLGSSQGVGQLRPAGWVTPSVVSPGLWWPGHPDCQRLLGLLDWRAFIPSPRKLRTSPRDPLLRRCQTKVLPAWSHPDLVKKYRRPRAWAARSPETPHYQAGCPHTCPTDPAKVKGSCLAQWGRRCWPGRPCGQPARPSRRAGQSPTQGRWGLPGCSGCSVPAGASSPPPPPRTPSLQHCLLWLDQGGGPWELDLCKQSGDDDRRFINILPRTKRLCQPQWDGIRRYSLWEEIGLGGRSLTTRAGVLIKETGVLPHPEKDGQQGTIRGPAPAHRLTPNLLANLLHRTPASRTVRTEAAAADKTHLHHDKRGCGQMPLPITSMAAPERSMARGMGSRVNPGQAGASPEDGVLLQIWASPRWQSREMRKPPAQKMGKVKNSPVFALPWQRSSRATHCCMGSAGTEARASCTRLLRKGLRLYATHGVTKCCHGHHPLPASLLAGKVLGKEANAPSFPTSGLATHLAGSCLLWSSPSLTLNVAKRRWSLGTRTELTHLEWGGEAVILRMGLAARGNNSFIQAWKFEPRPLTFRGRGRGWRVARPVGAGSRPVHLFPLPVVLGSQRCGVGNDSTYLVSEGESPSSERQHRGAEAPGAPEAPRGSTQPQSPSLVYAPESDATEDHRGWPEDRQRRHYRELVGKARRPERRLGINLVKTGWWRSRLHYDRTTTGDTPGCPLPLNGGNQPPSLPGGGLSDPSLVKLGHCLAEIQPKSAPGSLWSLDQRRSIKERQEKHRLAQPPWGRLVPLKMRGDLEAGRVSLYRRGAWVCRGAGRALVCSALWLRTRTQVPGPCLCDHTQKTPAVPSCPALTIRTTADGSDSPSASKCHPRYPGAGETPPLGTSRVRTGEGTWPLSNSYAWNSEQPPKKRGVEAPRDTCRQGHVLTEAEPRGMPPQTKGDKDSLELPEGSNPANTLISDIWSLDLKLTQAPNSRLCLWGWHLVPSPGSALGRTDLGALLGQRDQRHWRAPARQTPQACSLPAGPAGTSSDKAPMGNHNSDPVPSLCCLGSTMTPGPGAPEPLWTGCLASLRPLTHLPSPSFSLFRSQPAAGSFNSSSQVLTPLLSLGCHSFSIPCGYRPQARAPTLSSAWRGLWPEHTHLRGWNRHGTRGAIGAPRSFPAVLQPPHAWLRAPGVPTSDILSADQLLPHQTFSCGNCGSPGPLPGVTRAAAQRGRVVPGRVLLGRNVRPRGALSLQQMTGEAGMDSCSGSIRKPGSHEAASPSLGGALVASVPTCSWLQPITNGGSTVRRWSLFSQPLDPCWPWDAGGRPCILHHGTLPPPDPARVRVHQDGRPYGGSPLPTPQFLPSHMRPLTGSCTEGCRWEEAARFRAKEIEEGLAGSSSGAERMHEAWGRWLGREATDSHARCRGGGEHALGGRSALSSGAKSTTQQVHSEAYAQEKTSQECSQKLYPDARDTGAVEQVGESWQIQTTELRFAAGSSTHGSHGPDAEPGEADADGHAPPASSREVQGGERLISTDRGQHGGYAGGWGVTATKRGGQRATIPTPRGGGMGIWHCTHGGTG
ncbi:hypothetical protein Cadr_000019893 [Camelus dromedarius]|uniref:Uncharacterized protein n=1 Tax=Camelus dromedarius TaxID=9838 RepID=A0A5N4D0Y7_CAMDR|nr:hypothetical protein Cadr_000019893 [Camelus dromedarius]